MENKINFGTPFSANSSSAGTGSAAAVVGASGTTLYITDISGSSDMAGATLTVSNGSTAIWSERIGNTAPYQHSFVQPLVCSSGSSASVTVTSTSASNANISGFSLNH